jgi:hypothetical protein
LRVRPENRKTLGPVLLPALLQMENETMQSTIKNELTTSEAADVFTITEHEIRVLRHHLDAINNQIRGLECFMDSMGFTSYIGSNAPRSIKVGQFKVTADD